MKDDYNFNYEIIINILYLNGKPVLHIINAAILFQAVRFLPDVSVKTIWETLEVY